MVPYCGGAFLPAEQRYTSPIFRRLHRIDRAEWLNLSESAELVACMRLLGTRESRYAFQWTKPRWRQALRLYGHPPVWEASEPMHHANLVKLSQEDGEAALRAMQEGGFRSGRLPDFIRRSLQARRAAGENTQQIADAYGVTVWQMQDWITPRKPRSDPSAAASLRLLVG